MAKTKPGYLRASVVLATAAATLAACLLLLTGWQKTAQAAFPGANGKIVFQSNQHTQNPEGDSEIFVMNPDGSGLTNLTNNNIHMPEEAPAWSPDGRQIAFVCWDTKTLSAEICKMNADGSNRTQLTNDATSSYYYPAWSPDGTRITFSDYGHGYVYVMNADGTRQTRLAGGQEPNWSPDGKQIVFASTKDIYKMNADGTGVTQLTYNTSGGGSDTAPNWSPDGRQIVFQSSRDGNNHIYKMNADGSGQTRLTNNPLNWYFSGIYDSAPAWSPDGTKIVFQANRKLDNGMFQNDEIYVMNADGSGQTNLTNTANGYMDRAPDWQPVDNAGTAPVGSFTASAEDREVSLSWTNPTDADFDATRVLRSTRGFATGPEATSEQVEVYEGTSTSHTDTGLTNDTVYYYTAFARDKAGNWSKAATASASPVTSDASPPTTTATPSPELNEAGWSKDDVSVSLEAVDNEGGLGVKEITYGVNGGQPTTVQGASAQVPAITAEGETTIAYYATDNAGNTEEQKTLTVRLDKTAPGIGCGTADDLWHKVDVRIDCTASDGGGSGLANATDASFMLYTNVEAGTETDNASTGTKDLFDDVGNTVTAPAITGLKVDKKAPVTTADSGDYNEGDWTHQSVSLDLSATDGGSEVKSITYKVDNGTATTVNGDSATVNITDDADHTVTYYATDNAGNPEPEQTFNVRIDTSAPTYECTPTDDGSWHATNQTFQCTASDAGSGLASGSPSNFTLSTNVAADTETDSASTNSQSLSDAAGNTATAQLTGIKVDRKAPEYNCATDDGSWHSDNVSLACTATDGGSGIPAADKSFSLSTSVADGTETNAASTGSRTITDAAGNSVTAGPINDIKVDKKAPSVALVRPSDAKEYKLNETDTADYACQDGGSGVDSCAGPVPGGGRIDTASVGQKKFKVEATDKAGNMASLEHTYSVVYDFGGFFSPVNNLPTRNSLKTGSAVPVKFSLAGDQGLGVFEAGYPKSQRIDCNSAAQVEDIEETVTASTSNLSYDASADRYNYVWKTDKAWAGTCRQLILKLKDGTEYKVNFEFK